MEGMRSPNLIGLSSAEWYCSLFPTSPTRYIVNGAALRAKLSVEIFMKKIENKIFGSSNVVVLYGLLILYS